MKTSKPNHHAPQMTRAAPLIHWTCRLITCQTPTNGQTPTSSQHAWWWVDCSCHHYTAWFV